MEIKYPALSCALSVAAVMLFSPLLCRSGRQREIFSASAGIILFAVAKSIIVDCGWAFASLTGAAGGVLLEMTLMCGGILLCAELKKREKTKPTTYSFSRNALAGMVMITAGKRLLCDYSLVSDMNTQTVGEALGFAMLACAFCKAQENPDGQKPSALAAFAAVSAVLSFGLFLVLTRVTTELTAAFTAPTLVLFGACELVAEFAEAAGSGKDFSAMGFAGGFMLAYGVDSLIL